MRQTARVRISREQTRRIAAITREAEKLKRELRDLVRAQRPELLAETGCGPLCAAILIGQTAGSQRFPSDAHFARTAGVAPIPVSSGRHERHRLDRGGNRQLNRALHVIAITRGRIDPETRAYLQRKEAEGKSRMEAMRCLSVTSPAGTTGCSAKDRDQRASCPSHRRLLRAPKHSAGHGCDELPSMGASRPPTEVAEMLSAVGGLRARTSPPVLSSHSMLVG